MAYNIVAVNPTIANAFYDGAMGGMLAAAIQVGAVAASYASFAAVALAFAAECDAQFLIDTSISVAGPPNTTVAPVAGVTTANLNFKSHLAFSLAFGYFFGRATAGQGSSLAASYAGAAAIVAAAYTEAVTVLGTPLI
jgi:hypothetical protein